MRAPAAIVSTIAEANSCGVALGISPLPEVVSGKIDRTNKLQPGQIAGAGERLLARSIPATNVPCLQAALLGRAQVPGDSPGTSWMFSDARSGWSITTGPSINPTLISGVPWVR